MGAQTKEVGGGSAAPLADSANQGLAGLLGQGGNSGIFGLLNSLLSPGAGDIGKNISELISRQGERDVNSLRSRLGIFGNAFGTGAATAETRLRSETQPKLATAIGGLQLSALQSILPLLGQQVGRGTSQRQVVQQQGPLGQLLSLIAPAAGAALSPGGLLNKGGLAATQTPSLPQPGLGIAPGSFTNNFDLGLNNLPNLNFLAA